ncbi:UNVERIFIED_CONTAM: hypothetical protein K2H54_004563 [Gekko kuhli]
MYKQGLVRCHEDLIVIAENESQNVLFIILSDAVNKSSRRYAHYVNFGPRSTKHVFPILAYLKLPSFVERLNFPGHNVVGLEADQGLDVAMSPLAATPDHFPEEPAPPLPLLLRRLHSLPP